MSVFCFNLKKVDKIGASTTLDYDLCYIKNSPHKNIGGNEQEVGYSEI